MKIIEINTLEKTQMFAEQFIKALSPGICVACDGDLGAGKTTFVKFCAQALGVKEPIDSPTFNLLKTYEPPKLHHMDAYRLDGDAWDLEDALNDETAYIFLEWASHIPDSLPETTVYLKFSQADGIRHIEFNGNGVIREDIFND